MILILCGDCARQYDVTGFEPGDRVRCLCDSTLFVPARSPLPVTALRCTHCGGAVTPNDTGCPYCHAELEEKDRARTTICPACMARIDESARHCSGCGLSIRPQALTPLPHDRGCPRCNEALRVRSLGEVDVIECEACEGVWVRADVLEALCADAERNLRSALDSRGRELPVETPDRVRYLPCLTCGELMLRRQFRWAGRASGVIVDFCRQHGVWFDHDELESVIDFVRVRGRGADSGGGLGETVGGMPTTASRPPKVSVPLSRPMPRTTLVSEAIRVFLDLLW